MALERVAAMVGPLGLAPARLRRLETAVAEATMNAMEHGNSYRADRPVTVRVYAETGLVRVEVADLGGARPDADQAEVPDLEAKLAGLQRPRGWGLFLIKNMVDEARETGDGERHTVELVMHLEPEPTQGADDDDT
jgi:anti-sigma regulatory factor (Ser/Thr protein kinase)